MYTTMKVAYATDIQAKLQKRRTIPAYASCKPAYATRSRRMPLQEKLPNHWVNTEFEAQSDCI
jgi:hypothetical protein